MKHTIKQMLLTALATIAIVGAASLAQAVITGSAHDFSTGAAWNTSGEICLPCHAPHDQGAGVADAPLWNHQVPSNASFTPYPSGGTMDASPGLPSGVSLLCLSCHDGVTSLDAFGTETVGTTLMTGTAALGQDLSAHHPISFDYTDTLATADGGLHPPSTTTVPDLANQTIQASMLFTDSLECASCHDVHNDADNANLLLVANTASTLCLTCHNK